MFRGVPPYMLHAPGIFDFIMDKKQKRRCIAFNKLFESYVTSFFTSDGLLCEASDVYEA